MIGCSLGNARRIALLLAIAFSTVRGEIIITRDSTKRERPITSAEFRLTPRSESNKARVRGLTASVLPSDHDGNAEMRISAWQECTLVIRLPGPFAVRNAAAEMVVDGKRGLWWECGARSRMLFYERKDGGLEWEICLDSEPASNRFSFPIVASQLLFCYQEELNQDERAEGAVRPDSVVGSYAVYHQSRRHDWNVITGNDTLRDAYGTGKVFHIYRPSAHDANGTTVWCDLRIDTVLAITVPPEFLQSAVYPVTIDPTFGCTSAGATQTIPGTARADINDAHSHVAGSGETITSFSVYASSGSGTQSLGLAAYSMDDGSPKLPVNRLAPAATVALTGAGAVWYTTSTVSQNLTSGTRYCVALGDGNTYVNIYYDSYGSIARSNNATAALPATWTSTSTGAVVYSMYATYTVSAGPATPSRRRRMSFARSTPQEKGSEYDDTLQTLADELSACGRSKPVGSSWFDSHCQQ